MDEERSEVEKLLDEARAELVEIKALGTEGFQGGWKIIKRKLEALAAAALSDTSKDHAIARGEAGAFLKIRDLPDRIVTPAVGELDRLEKEVNQQKEAEKYDEEM